MITNDAASVPDDLPGAWNDIREQVRARWPRLTSDDLDEIGGSRTRLVDRIQLRYGVGAEEASGALRDFLGQGGRGRDTGMMMPSARPPG